MTISPLPSAIQASALSARDRILWTAHALFYKEGIRATGIDRIIAEAGVTKVTFYRHFPSKNDLIRSVLEARHRLWMVWFTDALARHGGPRHDGMGALIPTLREWFEDPGFRGCAFLNSVAEFGDALPEVLEITQRHKEEMTAAIAALLPPGRRTGVVAQAAAMAVDGAIVAIQFGTKPEEALATLGQILSSLDAAAARSL
jgi:AcrR family transcriptional regulator